MIFIKGLNGPSFEYCRMFYHHLAIEQIPHCLSHLPYEIGFSFHWGEICIVISLGRIEMTGFLPIRYS